MANRLNWSPGHEGKGNFYKNGEISTWNTDDTLSPHHQEMSDRDGQGGMLTNLGMLFYITPEGGIHDGGLGFNNRTAMTDEQVIATIIAQDPHLYDGREESEANTFANPPRVETPSGGYGHAWNLMTSAVDKSNWADCHAELKIPKDVRYKIRKWVDKLKWSEGSTKDDARLYHITVLSIDEYDEDFVRWMKMRINGRSFHFKSTGMDLFGPEKNIVVLRLECPEWRALAIEWGEEAEARSLSPRRFPNGPRAHITIGKTADGKWPQGVPDPHIEFDTATFNINKNAAIQWASGDGVCDNCGETQIGKDSEDGIATCSNCGAHINVLGDPETSSEQPISEELKQWLDSFPASTEAIGTIHHDNYDQMQPQTPSAASQGHFIDPPSHPYQPYNWAEEGDYSYFSKTSCFECGIDHPSDELCEEKKLAVPGSEFKKQEADWYDRAWHEPGSPTPWPNQPHHYKHDHAPDVKQSTQRKYYHVAPSVVRESIRTNGITPNQTLWDKSQPYGVYLWSNPLEAEQMADLTQLPMDVYEIDGVNYDELTDDPMEANSHIVNRVIPPTAIRLIKSVE